MSLAIDRRSNRLLAALPDAEWERWLPQLEPIARILSTELARIMPRSRENMTVCQSISA